jgi:UPF0176 protein
MIAPPLFCVAALYQFARFDDPGAVQADLRRVCDAAGTKGTLLIAREGINGTIAGAEDAVERVIAHIRTLPGCAGLEVKYSDASAMPFYRMKVRLKREIVTMGQPDIDPLTGAGHYVAAADWNALIDAPDVVVIDTRNDYEVDIGSFAGSIDPETRHFSEFPDWVRAHRGELKGKRVAMFCTGGIRCEKATAFLKAEGLDEVYHLKGGILKYLEEVPAADSRWSGECFVFDQRVAIGHGLVAGTYNLCHACRMPVSASDKLSRDYVEGVSCPKCAEARDETQRAGYAERHRQTRLAEARGTAHVGAKLPLPGAPRRTATKSR